MAQSLPKASPSSRPPAAPSVDGGRLITAAAAGVSVLLLSVTAVVLWPRTYGAEATFVLDGGAHVDNPIALAGRIEAALLEREVLASAAMDLPPELRSPDPIGKLRAGIRVQSRGALGYGVEFRGTNPDSVQRIANRLVDRAVTLVPKLATSPDDAAPMIDLAAKTRAVTEFLTAHPEMTVEQSGDKAQPAGDAALELLRTEKRQTEKRLANVAIDNPYAEPSDDPAQLARRLAELKMTIARREAALKQPKAASAPGASPELIAEWRALLAQMAAAQAKVAHPSTHPLVTAHVTSRAALPTSPLTPNRLVLSIVAVLLSFAAAMLAFVLPRKGGQRQQSRSTPPSSQRGQPITGPAPGGGSEPPTAVSDAPAAPGTALVRRESLPPAFGSEAPAQRTEPPLAPQAGSEPPVAPTRTVVLSSGASVEAPGEPRQRRRTSPGGIQAPSAPQGFTATVVSSAAHSPPAAPRFGSRPPPGAGSYSVSSSHPPPSAGTPSHTTVERLSPLQSARPPAPAPGTPAAQHSQPSPREGAPAPTGESGPQIMSRPPALDPEAERWAARFETPPPAPELGALEAAAPTRPIGSAPPTPEDAAPKRGAAGRWKTQVMGSMVPLEVSEARDGRRPLSEPPAQAHDMQLVAVQQAPTPAASTLVYHDVPPGWRPNVDPAHPHVVGLRDAILQQGSSRHLRVVVTGTFGPSKAQVAAALSMALAQAGARVLLVEADFDHPEVHQVMAISPSSGAGFSQQIIARRQGDQQSRPWTVVRCAQTLHVLAEGRLRSPGMLASEEFERAIYQLGDQHHVLVLSAPSLDQGMDLRAVDALAHAAIVINPKEAPSIRFGNSPLRALL